MVTDNKLLIGTEINQNKIIGYYTKLHRSYFNCVCRCSKEFSSRTDSIKSGAITNCGCLTSDLISEKRKLPNNQAIINLLYSNYKRNAKNRNLNFNISLFEFESFIFQKCYFCGQAPKLTKITGQSSKTKKPWSKGRRDRFIYYNGIDRLDSTKGYEVDNCVTCCQICNYAKLDKTLEEWMFWINALIDHQTKK